MSDSTDPRSPKPGSAGDTPTNPASQPSFASPTPLTHKKRPTPKQFRASNRPNLRGLHAMTEQTSTDPSAAAPSKSENVAPAAKPQPYTEDILLSRRQRKAASAHHASPRHQAKKRSRKQSRRSFSPAAGHPPVTDAKTTAVHSAPPRTPAATSGTPSSTTDTQTVFSTTSTPGTRHSKLLFDSFPAVVGWTSLGTFLPGAALIRANRKSLIGWTLLIGFVTGIALLIGYVVVRGPVKVGAKLISSPSLLTAISIVLVLGILIWAFVIIRSYFVSRRDKNLTIPQKVLSGVLIGSLLLIVGIPLGVGASYARMSSMTVQEIFGGEGGTATDKDALWPNGERINVFLIGRDNGDNREGTRPDTMLVASIDTASAETTLISVPRNLAFPHFPEGTKLAEHFPQGFDAYGQQESLINAVWTWSEENPELVDNPGELETGMFATMQAVEGSLGLKLNYWASVDMAGFEDLIDAMGGIDIDVERPIPIGGGTNLNTGLKNEVYDWINPGQQTLNGHQALWYARSREGSDNYDRMCRQQRLIKTTVSQMNPQDLALKFPELANSSSRNVATSVEQTQLGAFVELAWEMKNTKIKSAQINNTVVNTVHPDYDVLHEWVQEQTNPTVDSQAEEAQSPKTSAEPTATESTAAAPATDDPTQEGAPADGIETDEGKCYPTNYVPGSGWPGWPGNS